MLPIQFETPTSINPNLPKKNVDHYKFMRCFSSIMILNLCTCLLLACRVTCICKPHATFCILCNSSIVGFYFCKYAVKSIIVVNCGTLQTNAIPRPVSKNYCLPICAARLPISQTLCNCQLRTRLPWIYWRQFSVNRRNGPGNSIRVL